MIEDNEIPTALQLTDQNNNPIGITRKRLKIYVRNKGKTTAVNCKAKLEVMNGDSTIIPSDIKTLIWNDGEVKNDISQDDKELLHVIFSDSNFGIADRIFAMISTREAEMNPAIRAQDGLGVGHFEVEITITSANSSSVKKRFRITVNEDRNQFIMKTIK